MAGRGRQNRTNFLGEEVLACGWSRWFSCWGSAARRWSRWRAEGGAAGPAVPAAGGDEGAPERVSGYGGETLAVRGARAAGTEVREERGRQAGAEIRGQVRDPREVSAEFEAVPLAEALHRLLGDQNFALVYGHEGRLKSVRLLGGPQTAAAPAPAAAAAPPASQPPGPGIMGAV